MLKHAVVQRHDSCGHAQRLPELQLEEMPKGANRQEKELQLDVRPCQGYLKRWQQYSQAQREAPREPQLPCASLEEWQGLMVAAGGLASS